MSTIDLTADRRSWQATSPVEVLRPETPYECAQLPDVPSAPGDIDVPVRQLRDPFVLDEDGRGFLFYSFCGEQGIAGATLTLP